MSAMCCSVLELASPFDTCLTRRYEGGVGPPTKANSVTAARRSAFVGEVRHSSPMQATCGRREKMKLVPASAPPPCWGSTPTWWTSRPTSRTAAPPSGPAPLRPERLLDADFPHERSKARVWAEGLQEGCQRDDH